MGEADQFPFRSHLLQAAQQEPSKPAPLFDLPEHRFHDRPVQLPSRFRFQLLLHVRTRPTEFLRSLDKPGNRFKFESEAAQELQFSEVRWKLSRRKPDRLLAD